MNEQEYRKQIYAKAEKVKTRPQFNELLDEITGHTHDYGTIIYGCMAAMKAAFRLVNEHPTGGITGFQAGVLGWECVEEFMMIKPPCKILDYNHLLFPQYSDHFDKVISKDTWKSLQKKAKENLAQDNKHTSSKVMKHWSSVVEGLLPFGFVLKEE